MIRAALLCLSTLAAGLRAQAAQSPLPIVARPPATAVQRLEPLGLRNVSLDGGTLRAAADRARAFWLRVPNDDLLMGFRARAGLPAPGADLGGWYSNDVFHVFGQCLSALARFGASGDDACREKLAALVHGFAACIADDGYFYFSTKPNAPHYTYDKLVGGLADAWTYCGIDAARPALARITTWAEKHLDRARRFGDTSTEWYTLSENLLRASLATGDERYRRFAAVWEYPEWWRWLGDPGERPALPAGVRSVHAYSHVNTLGGLGAAWLVRGDEHDLQMLVRAHDELRAHHVFATGGFGPDEQLLPPADLRARLEATHSSFETQCGSWAVLKLCKYLLCGTGEARFGDWIELVGENGLLASLPTTDDGRAFYYSDHHPAGATKVLYGQGFACCTGTRPQALAEIADVVFLRAIDGLCVVLLTPATARFDCGGQPVTVVQRTRFPETDTTELRIATAAPVHFALRLRAPAWLAAPARATVGGESVEAAVDERGWITVAREWRNGDRLEFTLPMRVARVPLLPQSPLPAVLMQGPVALAVRGPAREAHALAEDDGVAERLLPVPGEPLTFHVRGADGLLVRPFQALREGEPYVLALDPALARRIDHREVTFSDGWNDAGRFRYGNVPGSTAAVVFEGTGIRWLGWCYDDAGRAEVRIDGEVVGVVDQYGPGRDLPFEWHHEGLAPGRHRLLLTILHEKSAASRDRFSNVAGFDVIGR
ncbi:MAG TPA: beta-L-arabinofuranosidase domain-containing protein [Planctomycetota bacterium]|nr:beta-L-arabinofuranosidase domain-containing protein [Planctomycetota bacterium]